MKQEGRKFPQGLFDCSSESEKEASSRTWMPISFAIPYLLSSITISILFVSMLSCLRLQKKFNVRSIYSMDAAYTIIKLLLLVIFLKVLEKLPQKILGKSGMMGFMISEALP